MLFTDPAFTRRRLLIGSAATAAAAALAGCGSDDDGGTDSGGDGGDATSAQQGSSADVLPVPSSFQEAPEVADLVQSGKLPPIEERLPENPYVVPHRWVTRGKYGGTAKMTMSASDNWSLFEYQYGFSFTRFLNDGLDIGPGLAEKWEVSPDFKEFTFFFRKGLKWSDGQPWTTADVMYWWEDMVLNEQHSDSPPDPTRDGRAEVATFTAVDDYTLTLTFKNPAPFTMERITTWVKGSGLGGRWSVPKHFAKQFHPKYNKSISDKNAEWTTLHDQKIFWITSPGCPTMTGWSVKGYKEGQTTIWERNPYYYAVTPDGDQLPYLDRIQWLITTDPEVQKVQITTGKFDYVHGPHSSLTLADYQQLKQAESGGKIQVYTWDSGSGTGSVTFFNHDHPDKNLRELLGHKEFRIALSYAYKREEAQKTIYYQQGELTSGTLGTKGRTFTMNDEAKKHYAQWRDAWLLFDQDKANQMLDELGLKDADGDGFREFADGSPIKITLDYPSDTSKEHIGKATQLARDWNAVGIQTRLNPTAPATFGDRWGAGKLMTTNAWEASDCFPVTFPGWVVPVDTSHWAPLRGQAYGMKVSSPDTLADPEQLAKEPWKRTPPFAVEADGLPGQEVVARLQKIVDDALVETDETKQLAAEWEIYKVHVEEGPFLIGVVANYPQAIIQHPDLRNIPRRENLALGGWTNPWQLPSPAVYDPEIYYWDNPDEHQS